jgi:hypothetical protein
VKNEPAQDSDEDDEDDKEVRRVTQTQPLPLPPQQAMGNQTTQSTPIMMNANSYVNAGAADSFDMMNGGAFCFPTGVSSFSSMTMPNTTPSQMYMYNNRNNFMPPFQPSFMMGGRTMPMNYQPFFSPTSMSLPCTCCLSGNPAAMGKTFTNSSHPNLWEQRTWQQPPALGQPPLTTDMFDDVPVVHNNNNPIMVKPPPTSPTSVACEITNFETTTKLPKVPFMVQGHDRSHAFETTGMQGQWDYENGPIDPPE